MKTLETERLILRDWSTTDIGCEVFGEGTIQYLIGAKNNYALVLKENGEVIGTVGLNEDDEGNPDRRNVGIRLLERYRDRGLMSEALEHIIANAKEVTEELSYLCMTDDKRSAHIAEKFGFRCEKTFYQVKTGDSDEPRDYHYYILPL